MKREDKYIRLDQESLIKDIVENIKLNKNEIASSLIKKYNIPIDRLFKELNNINLLKQYYPSKEHKRVDEIRLERIKFENKKVLEVMKISTFSTILTSSIFINLIHNSVDNIYFSFSFFFVGIPFVVSLHMLISWSKNKRKIKEYEHKLLDK